MYVDGEQEIRLRKPEEPVYPGVGIPETPRIPTGPLSLDRAAELLRVNVEDVMKLINENQLRLYPKAEGSLPGILFVYAGDVFRILVAGQQRDAG